MLFCFQIFQKQGINIQAGECYIEKKEKGAGGSMKADRTVSTTVFNIQTYCIHDGPGVRVTVFVKGCPLRCVWCANPESNEQRPQLLFYKDRCTACGKCVEVCEQKAISIIQKEEKFVSCTDRIRCKDCGACVSVCPADARELAGTRTTVAEAIDRVKKDKLFMQASGGGMTISGGECLFCPDFTENLLMAAHEEGISTAVESSVFASRETVDRIYRHVDLALCDIKHMNSAKHKEYTGVPNEQILANIAYIHNVLHVPVWIRVPVIPGYNDAEENIENMARFVKEELGEDTRVCLLPYHRLGESKNESLGHELHMDVEIPSDEYMQKLKAVVEKYGLTVQIGG